MQESGQLQRLRIAGGKAEELPSRRPQRKASRLNEQKTSDRQSDDSLMTVVFLKDIQSCSIYV